MRPALAAGVLVAALGLVPVASADSPLALGVGIRGVTVARWQQILNEWLGASVGRVGRRFVAERGRLVEDGVFGQQTHAATRAFQTESRIPVTGRYDPRSRLAWVGANVTCCGAGYPRVGPGARSGAVGWWQIALDRWLASRGKRQLLVDGVFGPATRAATISFQRAAGLRTTGIAEDAAWKAMLRRNLLHLP